MVKCSFTGKEIPPGRGIMYIQKDGRVFYFISNKAQKNMMKLNRKPRTTKWANEFHIVKNKEKK